MSLGTLEFFTFVLALSCETARGCGMRLQSTFVDRRHFACSQARILSAQTSTGPGGQDLHVPQTGIINGRNVGRPHGSGGGQSSCRGALPPECSIDAVGYWSSWQASGSECRLSGNQHSRRVPHPNRCNRFDTVLSLFPQCHEDGCGSALRP